ncbi:MAG: flotillin family protein [Deltaproteobacteria bacterium]|nr:MAG: flotillin family protein [Deltaproteobacteria bacterium]
MLALALLFVIVLAVTIAKVLYVCQPNEVLIFSGRSHRTPDGGRRGYRIVRGGRAIRIPLLETVDRMDLTNMIIDVTVRNAYSKGGIPLSVQGIANLKIPGEQPLLDNTLERFLGKSRAQIMKIARETLEGNLRGVLATLTPEEVNQDKERFAAQLAAEAEHDFHRLGLVLDTLKIQNVSDDVGYLDAIGRKRSAEIRRKAQVAEAEAQAEAAEQKWRNTMNAELAKIASQMDIAIKENERRIADATTRRAARIAEQVAEVQALVAKARAELEMQEARIAQVRLQLRADVIEPAEASRRKAEEDAKADAAKIVEKGLATAKVLEEITEAYHGSGTSGRDVLLMQKLLPLLESLAGTMGELSVQRLSVLGGSNGKGGGELAHKLVSASEQIKATLGIDVPQVLSEKLGGTPARASGTASAAG